MNILVATDGSDVSDTAVEHAAAEADAWDAPLEIVHVLTPETKLVDGTLVLPGEDEAVEQGERTLVQAERRAIETVANGDLEAETKLLAGRPAQAIVDRAAEIDARGIYVGHRGLSEERERVVGSVAKTVVDKATVPVTIVK
ncbi:universal stress protein [Natronolimnohabitans innermongolicus]|uniref:UspA domain protein n=1 Tax=Natronolimnohabitans innermongolicus JCM 12255 TaxID=1227499 RepID=L9X1B0_9EURY|nr:universal stress protein [Natronolimnohabitans innermongolicus]ELY55534.1 UspA domain protein [Natronolimnohabitans innermongolicus JCM 12255]